MAIAELQSDPHDQLKDAVEANDLNSFKRILNAGKQNSSIDLQHYFREPYFCTILDICCMTPGKTEFIKNLLLAGVDVNFLNTWHKKYPIHFAAMRGYIDVLQVLVEHPSTDVGILDGNNNSALYHAIKNEHVECFKLLIECKDIDPNRLNRRGLNAVHIAATLRNKNDEIMLAMIRCPRVNLDKIVCGESLRKTIATEYPHLENEMAKLSTRDIIDEDDLNPFLLYLYEDDIQGFISFITSHTDQINRDDGKYTLLQYACHYGLLEVVEVLLDLGADPNLIFAHNTELPIFKASYRGFADIIQLFLNSSKNICYQTKNNNVLLEVIKGSNTRHDVLGVNTDLCDHGRSIKLLLSVDSQYDINLLDFTGNTCLHIAALSDNREYIFSLLDHGAYLGRINRFGQPPLNELNYNTLKLYLNKCVSSNKSSSNDINYKIICSYKFLCPPKMYIRNYDNDNRIQSKTQDIIIENIPETTPLLYMTKISELRPLLLHPVLTNFLDLKWHKIKIYFLLNLVYYIGFVLFLTGFILLTSNERDDNKNVTSDIEIKIIYYLWFVMLKFVIVLGLRELFQIMSSPMSYLKSVENWLEIVFLITLTLILFWEKLMINYGSSKVSVSALVLLLAWGEMILLLGRHPTFAIRLEMFKCVAKNFIYFLLWYSFIGFAFTLSFYLMFNKCERFESFSSVILKTIIMAAVGEYDASNLDFGKTKIFGRLLFVLFVFFITLVLINLLCGLAVSDTQAIKSDADIVVLVSRIKFIHSVETMVMSKTNLDHSKRRFSCNILSMLTKSFLKELKLFPNALKNPKIQISLNQRNLIDFGSSVKKNSTWCISNFQGNYSDKETVEKTKEIIKLNSEKPTRSVSKILNEFVEKLNRVERAVNGIKKSMVNANQS